MPWSCYHLLLRLLRARRHCLRLLLLRCAPRLGTRRPRPSGVVFARPRHATGHGCAPAGITSQKKNAPCLPSGLPQTSATLGRPRPRGTPPVLHARRLCRGYPRPLRGPAPERRLLVGIAAGGSYGTSGCSSRNWTKPSSRPLRKRLPCSAPSLRSRLTCRSSTWLAPTRTRARSQALQRVTKQAAREVPWTWASTPSTPPVRPLVPLAATSASAPAAAASSTRTRTTSSSAPSSTAPPRPSRAVSSSARARAVRLSAPFLAESAPARAPPSTTFPSPSASAAAPGRRRKSGPRRSDGSLTKSGRQRCPGGR
mmetsp:Transcript_2100/g.6263  ORF Transcript_2100/g.6263 Transcript_2100/m.6263 type:complete len:312 (-) Transcript_2100:38-973(-)